MMPDEQELVDKAQEGDREAFTALVRQYQNKVFTFVLRMTGNREIALDLTQDTFLAAWQNVDGFRREAKFSTWLIQIAANKAKNLLKRSKWEQPLSVATPEGISSSRPDAEFEWNQKQARLLGLIGDLPVGQRAIFNLRYFDELKFGEIARIQNISVSAAKTQFAEAVKKLRKWLGEI